MKQKQIALSHRYATALRKHLKPGPSGGLQPALRLGRQAIALGLETLELARIHERALAALELSGLKNGLTRRAEIFFVAANTEIEESHHAARHGQADANSLNSTLKRRIADLTAANRQLGRTKIVTGASTTGGEHYPRLLKESLKLQEGLRQLTHKNLTAQERERHTLSHHLQDEIAQTLLSINVRLLNLRTAARGNKASLTKEIASTQRLVEATVKSINSFARQLDIRGPA